MKKNIFKIIVVLVFSLLINKISLSAPICSQEKDELNLLNEDKNQTTNNKEEVEKSEKEISTEEKKQESNNNLEESAIEISANEKIEVDKEYGVMIATGQAFVKEGETSLSADRLTAFSCETVDGDTKIIQINADNNVIIKSDQGNAYAERGEYFVEKRIIKLYENVKLEKDGDILVGDQGVFNIYTGKGEISVIPSNEGRKKVYGIIKSKKKQ